MALKKNKTGDGKVNWEGNLSGARVPRKSQAGLSKKSGSGNSLPQPGPNASPLSAGASPRRAKRSAKPGPSLPPLG
jgi:hypothetical protein